MRPVIVVFSHLRWGFVFQRPQHLLSRLAGRWRVVFVEEPVPGDTARLEVRQVQSMGHEVTLLVPHTPLHSPGFSDEQLALLKPLISGYLASQQLDVDVAWLYTPMALPLVDAANPRRVLFDAMDELSAFKDAPGQLVEREAALMRRADLVLAGGPSLYEARRGRHHNLHCIPSAVDSRHFSPLNLHPASPHAIESATLQQGLARPRLGYFGVIDERLDLALIAALADADPGWSVVMVGPVVKIDPTSLPQRPNLHWLGMQPYERLPYLLAGWDVCLMPFALNDATRFISPTKTLEYMAGDRPVVSTPVRDVISLYGEAVEIAPAGAAFVQACRTLLAEDQPARDRRSAAMLALVYRHSWDAAARAVDALLDLALDGPLRALPIQLRSAPEMVTVAGIALHADVALPAGHAVPAVAGDGAAARALS